MQLINDRTRTSVAETVELAETRKARRRGLLGRECLPEGAALMLIPCFAVHTASRARAVIELPAGRLETCQVKTGDRLYLAPVREQRRAS